MSEEMKRLTDDLRKDAVLKAESKAHATTVEAFVIFAHHKGYKITAEELKSMSFGRLSDDDLERVVAGTSLPSAPPAWAVLPFELAAA